MVRCSWSTLRRSILGVTWPLAMLSGCSPTLTAETVTYGPSEKVCQLTGDLDWSTGIPTSTRFKSTQFGLRATNLGYPVEHNGQLALLFGDTRSIPPRAGDASGPPDDAVGWITSRVPPTPSECTDLRLNHFLCLAPASDRQPARTEPDPSAFLCGSIPAASTRTDPAAARATASTSASTRPTGAADAIATATA